MSAVLTAAASLLAAPRAHAQERPALDLTWSAPAQCPQQPRARRLVAEYLGERELGTPAAGQRVLVARASIRRREQRWELRLVTSLDSQPGERTLAASTCADVADAAALVLAFAIDPGAALRHSAPTPAPSPAPQPAPPPPATPTRLLASASVRGAFGTLPGVSVGAALGLGVERGAWSAFVVGSAFAGRSHASIERPSAGGEFSVWGVSAAPCWSPAFRELVRLRACLPLELQRLAARGYGVDVKVAATRTELLLGAELTPGIGLSSRLELVAPLGLGVALRRPEFYLEEIGGVFQSGPVQGRVGLGLLARF